MYKPKWKKIEKFEQRIREITKRNRGVSAEHMISELNSYLRGWINYYARGYFKTWLGEKAQWIRRMVRQYLWKLWKKKDARKKHLRELGVSESWMKQYSRIFSSNRYWRIANTINGALSNRILHEKLGLLNIEEYYRAMHDERMRMDRTYNCQREFIFI